MTYSGTKAIVTTSTAVRVASGYNPCFTLTVKAIKASNVDNSGVIYLGGSDVSATSGIPLQPGDFFTFPAQETNSYCVEDIWINGTSEDGVAYIFSRR